ncbi:MAG: DUF2878 domain-containing protein [Bdellovibrionales bacterium]|nr:DUF2878 domain-containing protein [Bdellovibrionales bacterium]
MRRISFNPRATTNFLAFNLGWWACALGAVYDGYWWLGPALLPLWITASLWSSSSPKGEGLFLIFMGLFGFVLDTVLIKAGLFETARHSVAPIWLASMWILLGLTFESMVRARRSLWLLLSVGAVSGPLTYLWCEPLHLVRYARPLWFSLGAHAAVWSILIFVLFIVRDFCLILAAPSATLSEEPAPSASFPQGWSVLTQPVAEFHQDTNSVHPAAH